MKLVYLMRYWPVFGGGETVTRTLSNEMCKRGHEVYIIYLWDRTNNTDVYVDSRIKTIKIHGITNIHDGAIKLTEYTKLQKKLKIAFNNIKPDVIIDQWLPTKQVYKALKGLDALLIKCHHGSVKHTPIIRTFKQKLFYTIFKKSGCWLRVYPEFKKDFIYSDIWILLSEGSRKEAEKLIPWCDKTRIDVIPNPLPYDIQSEELDIENKKNEVVFVGRVIELKRVCLILKAWSLIEDKYKDWVLKIVGDGDYLDCEKKFAKNLDLKSVTFEGFKDAKPYLLEASIHTIASAQEGFGMVIVEAQQCGCVPVAFDSYTTIRDIIDDKKNGLLVKDGDVVAYAEAISFLIENPVFRKTLAKQAVIDSKKFSVAEICDKWEKLFKRLKMKRGGEMRMKYKFITALLKSKISKK